MTVPGYNIPLKTKSFWQHIIASLFFIGLALYSEVSQSHVILSLKQPIFTQVKTTPKGERVLLATTIYRANCRKMNTASAMLNLDELNNIAVNLDDKQLECSVFELRADYFSVNNGFNPKSTAYYQKAIDFAIGNNLAVETGIYQSKIAVYYALFKHNVIACKYFLDGIATFRKLGLNNIPQVGLYFTQVGNFYYTLGDYENAITYLMESLKYPIPTMRVRINTINSIGLIYRNSKNFDKALGYFNTALKLSQQSRDSAWIGIMKGNIGSVAFMQNQFAKAVPNLTIDYQSSLKYGEDLNAAIALLRLVKISIDSNKLNQASKQLDVAEGLIHNIADTLRVRIIFYELKAQFLERTGDLAQSISYRKKMEVDKDKLAQSNNIAALERVKLSSEIANNQMQLDKLKSDAQLDTFKRNTVIIILFLLIVISLLIYDQRLLKAKKDKELVLSQKRLVDEELKNAASELLLYTESLRQKNKLIEGFKDQVAALEVKFTSNADDEHLAKLMHIHIMTDENWDEFKHLFAKVHTGFFQSVRKAFPNLSNTDTRILSLMKLQLSNREMANMLGITIEGIKKSKQRLRKKMELTADDDLDKVVASF